MSNDIEVSSRELDTAEPAPLVREFRPVNVPLDASNDFETARRNVYEVMTRNADALEELIGVAAQAPHPRVFEVIGQLVKAGLDSSQTLMDIQTKQQNLHKGKADAAKPIEGVVLSSSDVLDLIKKNK